MPRTPSQTRARRLLSLLHLLGPDSVQSLDAMAERLGVDVAEVTADLELLACCGLHPYTPDQLVPLYVEEGTVVVFGQMPALERAVRLSPKEAEALAAALQAAGMTEDDPLVTKLLGVAAGPDVSPGELAQAVRTSVAPRAGRVLKALMLGLADRRVVRMMYHASGQQAPTERLVEPLALFNERGAWYVEAFCRRAGAVRTFRLDRVVDAGPTDERFDPRTVAHTGAAFAAEGLPRARVRLAPGEPFTLREWPGARLLAEDERGVVIEVPYAGTGWIARQVAARLGAAEVLEPVEVRDAVRALTRRGPGG